MNRLGQLAERRPKRQVAHQARRRCSWHAGRRRSRCVAAIGSGNPSIIRRINCPVRVAINLNRAIRADTPDQLARGAERRGAADRLQRLGFRARKTRDRHLPGYVVNADVGHFPRPDIEVRLEGFPRLQSSGRQRRFSSHSDAVLGLDFGASAIRRTRPWSESHCLAKANSLSLNTTLRVTAS